MLCRWCRVWDMGIATSSTIEHLGVSCVIFTKLVLSEMSTIVMFGNIGLS